MAYPKMPGVKLQDLYDEEESDSETVSITSTDRMDIDGYVAHFGSDGSLIYEMPDGQKRIIPQQLLPPNVPWAKADQGQALPQAGITAFPRRGNSSQNGNQGQNLDPGPSTSQGGIPATVAQMAQANANDPKDLIQDVNEVVAGLQQDLGQSMAEGPPVSMEALEILQGMFSLNFHPKAGEILVKEFPKPNNTPFGHVPRLNPYLYAQIPKQAKYTPAKTREVTYQNILKQILQVAYAVVPYLARKIEPTNTDFAECVKERNKAIRGITGLRIIYNEVYMMRKHAWPYCDAPHARLNWEMGK